MRERNFSTRACVLSRDVSLDALAPVTGIPPCVEAAGNGALCIPSTRSRAIVLSSAPDLVLGLGRYPGFLSARNIPDSRLAYRRRARAQNQRVRRAQQVLSSSLGVKNPTPTPRTRHAVSWCTLPV